MDLVTQMTAPEVARRSSNPGALLIIEILSMINTMLLELPAVEANDGAVHTFTRRTIYPGGMHRIYNQGVKTAASLTKQIREWIAMLEVFSKVDVAMAQHSGNPAGLYNSEAQAFLTGMALDQANDLIYGDNSQDAAYIDGLATRYGELADSEHVIDADMSGTTGHVTSIYLVACGRNFAHLIYPRGSSSVGVNREDLGIETVTQRDDVTREYRAHVDHFTAQYGLAVEHPDSVVRIANIPGDVNALTPDMRKVLIELILFNMKTLPQGVNNVAIFANKSMQYEIERAAREIQYVIHPEKDPWGNPVQMVQDARVRRMDAILSTEELVA